MRYFVEIEKEDGSYRGQLHKGEPSSGYPLSDLKLGPDHQAILKGQSFSLSNLTRALIEFQKEDLKLAFDERGQLELGTYLFDQIFSCLKGWHLRELLTDEIDLRIVTDDEHIGRLPWALLAQDGIFLSTQGWSVSLSTWSASTDCELRPSPRVLIVAPQPARVADTRAKAHIEQLEGMLSSADKYLQRGSHLMVVSTWEEFKEGLEDFRPDVVYYYGHGVGNVETSRLIFAGTRRQEPVEKTVASFANCLHEIPKQPPLLVYLNCCHGDAGGLLGAGRQLGRFVPAVVTNRTIAKIDAAQQQALFFWEQVLLNGLAPHEAVSEMRCGVGGLDLDFKDVGWMTPVLHCHYDRWISNPPQPVSRLERDPNWRLKLDRVPQFSQVYYLSSQMLQEQTPTSYAFAWYGGRKQGLETFHQRIPVELREKLRNVYLYEVRPDWPHDFRNPQQSFFDMLTEAFEVHTLEHILALIRTKSRGVSGRQTLVYVRHPTVPRSHRRLINPRILTTYLEWWDKTFAPGLASHGFFALLGISFEVEKPMRFYRAVTEKSRLDKILLARTVFRLLEEMADVDRRDLIDFLQTHRIPIPPDKRDRILEEILERTEGRYDLTLEALKDLEFRTWSSNGHQQNGSSEDDDFDY